MLILLVTPLLLSSDPAACRSPTPDTENCTWGHGALSSR